MPLAAHIDPDAMVEQLRDAPHSRRGKHTQLTAEQGTPYTTRYNAATQLSKHRIPHDGAPADAVAQMLRDELDLDGRPNLNLASFVGTYMEKAAEQLMIENLNKNMSDADEYPAMMDIHARCKS
jgi:glutamate decarboxylase